MQRGFAGLYFITDRKLSKSSVVRDAEAAIKGSAAIVQYRENALPKKEMLNEASEIQKMCKAAGIPFMVNNYMDLMLELNADGVHLGQEDMPLHEARKIADGKIIGITVHNLKEAKEAEAWGASYVAVSPVFETKTKMDAGKAVGLELLKEVKENVRVPVVAIGGINMENLDAVLDCGVYSIAMISAVLEADDVRVRVQDITNTIKKRMME